MTVEDAARDLGCHVRTIWRDVDVLARAGFPVSDDNGEHDFRMNGSEIRAPADPENQPNRQFLEWHAETVHR